MLSLHCFSACVDDAHALPLQATPPDMAQRAQQALAGLMCATQLLLCPLTADLVLPAPAQAVLKSPNAQIPRSVDAALRRCVLLAA